MVIGVKLTPRHFRKGNLERGRESRGPNAIPSADEHTKAASAWGEVKISMSSLDEWASQVFSWFIGREEAPRATFQAPQDVALMDL